MIRVLPFLIELILVVFCLVDCIQADQRRIRNLPRWAWVLAILIVPIVGCIARLLAGRPPRSSPSSQRPSPSTSASSGFPGIERPRPVAPDDDPEFLSKLKQSNAEHERLLKRWEEELKRREDELRKDPDSGSTPDQA